MDKSVNSSRTQPPAWDMDPSPHYFMTLYSPESDVGKKIQAAIDECETEMAQAKGIQGKDLAKAKLEMYAKIKKAIDEG
jgi:hypothetical protein